jgi:hypothetical protein
MENPAATVLLVEVDGMPAATVMVGYDGHRGWVYYLGVAPAFQRQGLAACHAGGRSLAGGARLPQDHADGAQRQSGDQGVLCRAGL